LLSRNGETKIALHEFRYFSIDGFNSSFYL